MAMEIGRFLPDSPTLVQVQAFLDRDVVIRNREGIRERHNDTYNHLLRAAYISARIAQDSGKFSPEEVVEIAAATKLHDVGKDFIDPRILDETGELTKNQRQEIQQHPEAGFKWLSDARRDDNSPTLITPHVLLLVKYHHALQGERSYPVHIDHKNPESDPDDFPKGEERGKFLQKLFVVVAADLADAGFLDRPYHKAKFKGLSEPQLAAERAKLYIQMGESYPGPQLFLDLAIHYAALARGQIPRGFSRN